ncbi:claudin-18 isoform X2 [Coregonus clupeaformis]|uniref:claudin-18 isoform X2 n=1 Tax=Coregonus clupeaformis TaxID=59861 RepID=UPI001BDF960A|nr:claudin-18 isoform X2 [Coregonus clupeaformis]
MVPLQGSCSVNTIITGKTITDKESDSKFKYQQNTFQLVIHIGTSIPGTFQAVRALMIVGIVLGVIGAMIALFSLKCLKMGSMEDSSKAKMTLTAGVMFIIAGICAISGASIYANQIVASFMMTTYNPNYGGGMGEGMGMGGMGGGNMTPRYTFGPALFVAWIGAALLLLGGILKCVAFRGLQPDKSTYTGVAYKAPQAQNRPVYDDHHTEDGKRDNQKYV